VEALADCCYNLNGTSREFVVAQLPTSIQVSPYSFTYGDPATVTATVEPHVAGMTVDFLVDGQVKGQVLTDANGQATSVLTPPFTTGSHTLTVTVRDEARFKTSTAQTTLAINGVVPNIAAPDVTTPTGQNFTVMAQTDMGSGAT